MTGSIPFSIDETEKFKRSLKKLKKVHGNAFIEFVIEILEDLMVDQYPNNSRQEPLPGKMHLPQGWTFHKIDFTFSKGASGQIRLMYLVGLRQKVARKTSKCIYRKTLTSICLVS